MKERDNRLSELRDERNLSQTVVGDMLNLTQTRVSAYERGDSIPSDILKVFADFYCVSTDYILRLSDVKNIGTDMRLSAAERLLIDFYRRLSPESKRVIDGMVYGYGYINKDGKR